MGAQAGVRQTQEVPPGEDTPPLDTCSWFQLLSSLPILQLGECTHTRDGAMDAASLIQALPAAVLLGIPHHSLFLFLPPAPSHPCLPLLPLPPLHTFICSAGVPRAPAGCWLWVSGTPQGGDPCSLLFTSRRAGEETRHLSTCLLQEGLRRRSVGTGSREVGTWPGQ